jgi:hypothetical protein
MPAHVRPAVDTAIPQSVLSSSALCLPRHFGAFCHVTIMVAWLGGCGTAGNGVLPGDADHGDRATAGEAEGADGDASVMQTDGEEGADGTTPCGNGIIDPGEQCDGGQTPHAICSSYCQLVCEQGYGNCDNVAANGCEEPLTTSAVNCGACGRNCLWTECIGGYCVPQFVAAGSGYADAYTNRNAIVIDDTCVYWTSQSAVYRALKDGTGSAEPIAESQTGPGDLKIGAGFVYWSDIGSSLNSYTDGAIFVAPTDLSAPPTSLLNTLNAPRSVSWSEGTLYWASYGTAAAGYSDGAIESLDLVGSQGRRLLWGSLPAPVGLVIAGTDALWARSGTMAADYRDGRIFKSALNGQATPSEIAADQTRPWALAVDDVYYYWVGVGGANLSNKDGDLVRLARSGVEAPNVLVSGLDSPITLAVDGVYLYWGSGFGVPPVIQRIRKDGSQTDPETIATLNSYFLASVALDETALYWLDLGNRVYRVAK